MAQLALAVAGAAVGSFFGPVGTQIGFALGSMLGGALFAEDIRSQGLSDLTVAINSYGEAIPETWGGTMVQKCSLIWSTQLIQSESSESAKGGPDIVSKAYSISCAVRVAGLVGGFRRIWAGAKLVYDAREDADAATLAGNAAFLQYATFYLGTEDQMPDPTIEAIEGVGNVEAYRGVSYFTLTNFPLADFGNVSPPWRVEVTSETPAEVEVDVLVPYDVQPWSLDGTPTQSADHTGPRETEYTDVTFDGVVIFPGPYSSISDVVAAVIGVYPQYEHVIGWRSSINSTLDVFESGASLDDGDFEFAYVAIAPDAVAIVQDFDTGDGSAGAHFIDSFNLAGAPVESPPYDDASSETASVLLIDGGTAMYRQVYSTFAESPPALYPDTIAHNTGLGATSPAPFYPSIVRAKLIEVKVRRVPGIPSMACVVGDPVGLGIAQLPGDSSICMTADGALSPNVSYADEAGTFKQLTALAYSAGELVTNGLGPVLRSTNPDYSSETYWTAAANAAGISGTYGVDYPATVSAVGAGTYEAQQVEAGSALLSDIVTDLCVDAGLTAGQLDVTALVDVVPGYQRTRVMSARAALEPLRMAYFFDGVESGDEIRFVKRGGASVATLTLDDLGAGLDAATEPIEHDRGQETELPASVSVAYQSPTADYQIGVQQSRRRVGGSQQAVQAELPLVLADLTAAQIADVLLYDAWASRTGRKTSVTRAHAYIEPTDVITLNDGATAYRVRVVDKVEDGGVITLDCRDDDASSYTTNSTAGEVSGGGSTVRFDGPANLQIMDIPLVRDVDDAVALGYYMAASGYASGWRGGRAYRSADAGTTYAAVQDINHAAVIGYAVGVLGDFDGGNVVDELSTVDVTLHAGTLSSVTRAQLLGGGNGCVLGSEVLQFQRAVLLAGTTYRLSGFLRARGGTEQHMASHAVGERFVLLSPSNTYRVAASLSEIGIDAIFKCVTYGSGLADAYEREHTHTAAGAKPLSVVQLDAAPSDTPGEYLVRWVRRSRIGAAWLDSADAPLGEVSESYTVLVETGLGVVTDTQTVSDPEATVVAASGYVITVWQLSDAVGLGFPATYTIP